MPLALFDLDNTLLAGDSDYLWGRFLIRNGIVDAREYEEKNRQFFADYKQGRLDIDRYLRFALAPLSRFDREQLHRWREAFLEREIRPIIAPGARELLRKHRDRGDLLMIISATNAFVTRPIADLLGVAELLATEPESIEGRYTGRYTGVPTFREGKVEALRRWLEEQGHDLAGSHFYSDSHNDLPLLQQVDNPVAVDPDPVLRKEAEARGWPVISLR
jgi:HAD superfamily hydrolase (TIGR01490 family)